MTDIQRETPLDPDSPSPADDSLLLGLDVGSTTVKAVAVDPATGSVLYTSYERHHAHQAACAAQALRAAARALDGARRDVARALGGGFRPADVTFTSGGTELNNLAILGLAEGVRARSARRRRVLLSAIEHDSVLDLTGPLRSRGFEVELIGVGRDGAVDPDALDALLDDTCALVSVMAANNETGR